MIMKSYTRHCKRASILASEHAMDNAKNKPHHIMTGLVRTAVWEKPYSLRAFLRTMPARPSKPEPSKNKLAGSGVGFASNKFPPPEGESELISRNVPGRVATVVVLPGPSLFPEAMSAPQDLQPDTDE